MKITLKNLGPIKEAEFELGDFIIICGRNNTGKTYITYLLYELLRKSAHGLDAAIAKSAFLRGGYNAEIYIGSDDSRLIEYKPFIVSAERTGAALFQREVDFTRSKVIDLLKETDLNPKELLGRFTADYPTPVKHNIDFVRDLPNIVNKESIFARQYPEVLRAFSDLLGGDYALNQTGGVEYIPDGNTSVSLSLAESSSTVRSLVNIGFYLRHVAQPGDLLMVDEPELNLHPENQRKVARLFALLVNHGIRVFITTHSDYLIRELNTLLLLNKPDDERLQAVMQREGYQAGELLKPEQLRVYMTAEDVTAQGSYTLKAADISAEKGIALTSFDDTIEEMNRIQDEIIWGE
uniref:Endonuclease GajA/Old nuclease/RecF-like AAA domain-containing protein n=1 Tax=uncultured Thiotrichaceae bacterium TaxID=298394 RepID=A0A6S6SMJ4_9GAMM|nr:MAG: Unknown protein [uncultured Thiotrichaceae bacterium]